eukprot:TRINITY_DN3389_c0_g1_i1.p1 TRINITY_DN3389_c0_g1~~TRINITY_DN3389_c0_g1_i1.p1  ORF type:complete len:267 (+),score=22.43 TRINITY_DN3389_c0_g1_i1:67-867(+)
MDRWVVEPDAVPPSSRVPDIPAAVGTDAACVHTPQAFTVAAPWAADPAMSDPNATADGQKRQDKGIPVCLQNYPVLDETPTPHTAFDDLDDFLMLESPTERAPPTEEVEEEDNIAPAESPGGKALQEMLKGKCLNICLEDANTIMRAFSLRVRSGGSVDMGVVSDWAVNRAQVYKKIVGESDSGLEHDEVKEAVEELGHVVDKHAFEAAFKAYDAGCDGRIFLSAFLGMCAFLKRCLDENESLGRRHPSGIRLTFSQFVAASASCM